MPNLVFEIAVDGSLFVECHGQQKMMLDFALGSFGGLHIIATRASENDPLGWEPATLYDGTIDIGESVPIELDNAETVRLRVLNIHDGRAKIAFAAPSDYEFHGDGIG